VLVVQDTTSLNLTGCRVLPELGPIGSGHLAHGVLLHSTLGDFSKRISLFRMLTPG
jgi:hypothetical protein